MMLQDPTREQLACKFDYTMIFPDKTGLSKVFEAFPEFEFTGGWDGHSIYPRLTKERFLELAAFVWDLGDFGVGLMTVFNMIAILPFGGEAIRSLNEYVALRKAANDSK